MSDLLYLVKSSRITPLVKQQDVVMQIPLECSTGGCYDYMCTACYGGLLKEI